MTRDDPTLQARLAACLEPRSEILEAYLFGSAATGSAQAHSDVDVAVYRVLRDGIRILSRDLRATTTREGQALSRFCDYVPQLAKIEAAHRTRIDAERF